MPFEGLLSKLGPSLVREVMPHMVQLIAGMGERFRKDTREIKTAVDAEMAAVARTHAGLASAVEQQRERLDAISAQVTTVDRRLEILHKSVDALTRQLARDAEGAAKSQRSAQTFALLSAVLSALACGAAGAVLLLHR